MSSSMLSTTMNSPVSGPVAAAASKTCYQNQTFNKTYNIYSLFMQTSMNFVTTSHVIELKHCCCHCVQHSSDSDLELFTPEQKLRLLRLLTQNSVTGDNWSWLWLHHLAQYSGRALVLVLMITNQVRLIWRLAVVLAVAGAAGVSRPEVSLSGLGLHSYTTTYQAVAQCCTPVHSLSLPSINKLWT